MKLSVNNRGKLGVIIPTYNCKIYINEMIDSILNQSYSNWKLVLIDDGSTDNTLNILLDYQKNDDRIEVYKRDRLPSGAPVCRNIGLEKVLECHYVIWFDADDIIAPYCFEQRIKALEENPDLDFAVFPSKSFGSDIHEKRRIYGVRMNNESVLSSFLTEHIPPFAVWTNIYRRSSLEKYQLRWDEFLLSKQDSDFNIQSILKGCTFQYIDSAKIDYFYRIVPNSIAKGIGKKKHFSSHLYLIRKISQSIYQKYGNLYKNELNDYILSYVHIFAQARSVDSLKELMSMQECRLSGFYKFRLSLLSYLISKRITDNSIRHFIIGLYPLFYIKAKKRFNHHIRFTSAYLNESVYSR